MEFVIGKRYRVCCPSYVRQGCLKHGVIIRLLNFSIKKRLGTVKVRPGTREELISLWYLKPYKKGKKLKYRDNFPVIRSTDIDGCVSRPLSGSAWDGKKLSAVTISGDKGNNHMGKGSKKVRSHKKTAKAKKTKLHGKKRKLRKSKKAKGKGGKKRGSIAQAIYDYFDRVGLDNITYKQTLTVAKKVKPDTAFNRSHFSWYRNKYRLLRDLD